MLFVMNNLQNNSFMHFSSSSKLEFYYSDFFGYFKVREFIFSLIIWQILWKFMFPSDTLFLDFITLLETKHIPCAFNLWNINLYQIMRTSLLHDRNRCPMRDAVSRFRDSYFCGSVTRYVAHKHHAGARS